MSKITIKLTPSIIPIKAEKKLPISIASGIKSIKITVTMIPAAKPRMPPIRSFLGLPKRRIKRAPRPVPTTPVTRPIKVTSHTDIFHSPINLSQAIL